MKPILLSLAFLCSFNCFSQNDGDRILGKWLKIPKKDLIIEVFKSDQVYQARILWATDSINKPVGYLILKNLEFDAKNDKWDDGKLTDPRSGKTYSASADFKDEILEVHAFMGVKFLGTKRQFERAK